jgi:hypothetical protein
MRLIIVLVVIFMVMGLIVSSPHRRRTEMSESRRDAGRFIADARPEPGRVAHGAR